MNKFSLLELLHPDGIADKSFVLGSNCPEILCPESQGELDGNTEVFILAPSTKECNLKGWLETAVESMSLGLSPDGVGYVLVPSRWRWKLIYLLSKVDLKIDTFFWHFPDWSSSRYLVPIVINPAYFAINSIFTASSLKQTLARQMFGYAGTRWLLAIFWDPTAISVRRSNARPLFQWLFNRDHQPGSGTAILHTSWRGGNGSSISYGFLDGNTLPSVIVKTVAAENAANLNREAKVLKELGPAARSADIRVPEIVGNQQNDQRSSLFLSFLPGQAASDLIASDPSMCSSMMARIVDWLERWHRSTVKIRPLQLEQFEQDLLRPIEQFAASLQNADRYRERIVATGRAIIDKPVPWVDTHNDLTMANVLLDEHNQLGLVDWETGSPESWPLVDFNYAVTDAVRIAAGCRDWLDAFKACFLPEGSYFAEVTTWRKRLQGSVGSSPEFDEMCFHACWLHHASNEHQVSRAGTPRPFFEIVQWIALHESIFNQNYN